VNWSVYFDETQNFMHMVIAMPTATISFLAAGGQGKRKSVLFQLCFTLYAS